MGFKYNFGSMQSTLRLCSFAPSGLLFSRAPQRAAAGA
jgi:hypothetical protein